MKNLLLCILITALAQAAPQQAGFQWNPIQIGKTSFIPLEKVKDFYGFQNIATDEDVIIMDSPRVKISLTVGSYVAHLNGVKFLTAYPVRKLKDTLYISQQDLTALIDPVLRPQPAKNLHKFTTVVLDPGHGGADAGAAGKEAKHTLALALQVKALLEKQKIKVVMTRDQDEFVPLAKRVKIANAHKDAIMVSLHFNSGNKHAKGLETYVMSALPPAKNNASSLALATAVHSRTLLKLGEGTINDRGIRRAKFSVLKGCIHPAILIEAGFLTNKEEAAMIEDEAFQKKLASGIVRGIYLYRNLQNK